MGTRGAIIRHAYESEGGSKEEPRWTYHHWDSYPEGLGAALLRLYDIRYLPLANSCKTMREELIDAHPDGWSTLVSFGRHATEEELQSWDGKTWNHVDTHPKHSDGAAYNSLPVAYEGDKERSDPDAELNVGETESWFYTYLIDDEGLFIGLNGKLVRVPWAGPRPTMKEVEAALSGEDEAAA